MQDPSKKEHSLKQAISLEREAYDLRSQQQIEKAFEAYDKAASFYQEAGEHLKSAMCYASAASCWNIHTGWQPLKNAATRNHFAAQEAMKSKSYDYARSLFREAAILYEREGDGENYSACFMGTQRADANYAWEIFLRGKSDEARAGLLEVKWKDRVAALGRWLFNTLSRLIWGYGERPLRTLLFAAGVILVSAFFYDVSGRVLSHGVLKPVSYFDSLYFSIVTFATVGYGDYLPVGWVRLVSVLEGLSGIFLAPLFLVALTRRYLRMYR